MAQLGSQSEVEKPKFASLRKGQSIESITLNEVIELFKLPRQVGQFEDKLVTVAVGDLVLMFVMMESLYLWETMTP
ncbi:MAG: hypothetical protein CM15mP23_01410 [Cryomorphaceae bacterium]|nr:MAG: hypothetical protein CM15mP23_01410 [Cryomorphaceae bacterium]